MEKIYITKSNEQTEKLGESFARSLSSHAIICLYGDLGGGKTTFVKGAAKGLGVVERVISPTFVITRSHDIRKKNLRKLFHVDLYRLKEDEIGSVDIEEMLDDESCVVFIEWAQKAEDLLSKYKKYKIYFKDLGENQREIIIKQ